MKVAIDNLDGKGAVDWTGQVAPEGPLRVERRLNEPSLCGFAVLPMLDGTLPRRTARVVVSAEDGTVLFTGYVTRTPDLEYVGEGSVGAVYLARVLAESDEWLLDKQGRVPAGRSFGLGGGALLQGLVSRVDAGEIAVSATAQVPAAGRFAVDPTKAWSANAGAAAGAVGASYRVLGGALTLLPMGAVQHAMTVPDGTLLRGGLVMKQARGPANDVTVSGAMEAGAFVTEVFSGDGTTVDFALAGAPFRTGSGVLAEDSFAGAALNTGLWQVSDPGSHLALGAAGLVLSGGNGQDGATTLVGVDQVELGGTLVLEANAVALNAGSDGVLLGLYSGLVSRASCVAGVDVRSGSGGVTVQGLLGGAAVGTAFAIANGHSYILRMRVHCSAVQRVRQTYRVLVGGVVESFGGAVVDAPLRVVLEVRDAGASSNTPVTVLYDGGLPSAAGSAMWAPVNSVQLLGSVGAVKLTQTGSAWVVSQTSSGPVTRLVGVAGEGVDCSLSAAGELRFFAGRVPAAGEQVMVSYRTSQRAVARSQDAASVAAEAAGGLPGIASWAGHVLEPEAMSSEDCANAAAALLAVSSTEGAAVEGTYKTETGGMPGAAVWDVWPGDLLVPDGAAGGLAVRSVVVTDLGAEPEGLRVEAGFANEWAKPMAMRLSETLASDVGVVPVGIVGGVADLSGLTVTGVTTTAVQIDTGVVPPAGGGFEVRRREGAFGPGQDGDLILRSPVRGFSVPRSAQVEGMFVRMYDGSTPPRYSVRSAVVRTDVPVG